MDFDSQGPPLQTKARGIFAGDLILRSALLLAIEDLRSKPWLLKYAFAGIPQDTQTAADYGQNEVDRAVQWFLSHNIPVFLNIRMDDVTPPCISIKLVSSENAEATLADVNYEVQEQADYGWPNLAGPFVGTYDQTTGIVQIPDNIAENLVLARNQVLVDATGKSYTIESVLDFTQVKIAKDITGIDLTKTFVRGQPPGYITTLESQLFKETYQIGCHAIGEPAHLVYLHSIVVFILLMYKQSLLEARNLERSQISSTDLVQNTNFDHQLVYSRYINLTGYCEQSWPKTITPKITALQTQLRIAETDVLFGDLAYTQSWIGEQDPLGTGALPASPPPGQSYSSKTGSGAAYPLVYWGEADLPILVDEAFVESLPLTAALAGRQTEITYNALGIKYCWYAYPAVYGGTSDNFIDNGTGFLFGATNVATVSVTDSFGVTRPYFVFRSNNPGLGFVYLKVT